MLQEAAAHSVSKQKGFLASTREQATSDNMGTREGTHGPAHLLSCFLVSLELVPLMAQPVPHLPFILLFFTEPLCQLFNLIQHLLLLL